MNQKNIPEPKNILNLKYDNEFKKLGNSKNDAEFKNNHNFLNMNSKNVPETIKS